MLDCSRACITTCKKQYIISFQGFWQVENPKIWICCSCWIWRVSHQIWCWLSWTDTCFRLQKITCHLSSVVRIGRLFSPFSSILFTETSSYRLPVFKDNGSVWEFDELIYFTASKFADGGSSARTPLTVISISQTPSLADGVTGFSQSNSGSGDSGEGEKNKKWRLEKGKERDKGDKDEADKGSDDSKDPPGDDQGGIIAGPAKISFEIASEIYPIQDSELDEQNAFQTLTMHGGLTIEVLLYCYPIAVISKIRNFP